MAQLPAIQSVLLPQNENNGNVIFYQLLCILRNGKALLKIPNPTSKKTEEVKLDRIRILPNSHNNYDNIVYKRNNQQKRELFKWKTSYYIKCSEEDFNKDRSERKTVLFAGQHIQAAFEGYQINLEQIFAMHNTTHPQAIIFGSLDHSTHDGYSKCVQQKIESFILTHAAGCKTIRCNHDYVLKSIGLHEDILKKANEKCNADQSRNKNTIARMAYEIQDDECQQNKHPTDKAKTAPCTKSIWISIFLSTYFLNFWYNFSNCFKRTKHGQILTANPWCHYQKVLQIMNMILKRNAQWINVQHLWVHLMTIIILVKM